MTFNGAQLWQMVSLTAPAYAYGEKKTFKKLGTRL